MSDNQVPLQRIIDWYRNEVDELSYQLICHKIIVEQKEAQIAELQAELDTNNLEKNEDS